MQISFLVQICRTFDTPPHREATSGSGIDHHAVNCNTTDLKSFRLTRAALMMDWLESEFEVVNTTFLSDLDY